ncbi:Pseudouridine-5'-phosphatase [Amphibalanus amphitrite]|uniref:pseudouridine 5'-phosphatase n=1 Tax=Amphibalanus amphitrite TaxID=1232801 RepID=A0A6A4WWL2_AMPAM|nr:pseudouridine-5'-phosphatase-like [Amphibalanus amphitrite]XP_043219011.1 pseudouridine-5'-phosphatase-like [Amphibalanus amphitrite]XP_043222313.1 pseudouridine-5'-phosphatase-like [Amphibalanus amphitrite]XP_043222314.1 pseudouridine-5'-phosphatase-like [Amphibalanus amphitrite]XP_043222316.1 pseudouridine-5'-phosphatase-like [Amphibalanus amphitrite]XP_043222317.1 pseudouridine-5'-phosphatase-like [Amphibalanus amphitrite]KAF0308060.1 Pseudouridine-5'-phosphatase [Amphibalanus amphitrit
MPANSSEPSMEPKAVATHVIFDVDGLLLNTETLYTKTTDRVVGQFGKKFTWEMKLSQMGMKGSEAAARIIEQLELPLTSEEYLRQSARIWEELFPSAELMPGAERLVRHLHKHRVPIALASGGSAPNFELKTSRHDEFFSLFSHVVLASSDPAVKNGKPAPDVYQIAAERFAQPPARPEDVLTFEDAPNGVLSARAAGMHCVMVPDARMPEEKKKEATLVLSSLEDFRPEMFGLPAYDA